MKAKIKLTQIGGGAAQVTKAMADLSRLHVYVGIPEANAGRPNGDISNAQLAWLHTHGVRGIAMRIQMGARMINRKVGYDAALQWYLHTHGSPLWHIPPRPIIEPAIEEPGNKARIVDQLRHAGESMLKGNKAEAIRYMHMAGMVAQNIVRGWFTDPRNNWAPNAPSTIKAKGSDRPLIDTGEMRKSVTYVVDDGR